MDELQGEPSDVASAKCKQAAKELHGKLEADTKYILTEDTRCTSSSSSFFFFFFFFFFFLSFSTFFFDTVYVSMLWEVYLVFTLNGSLRNWALRVSSA